MTLRMVPAETVIAHPARVGILWSTLTISLIVLALTLAGLRQIDRHEVGGAAVLVIPIGLAFGYLLRWNQLREVSDAR